MVWVFVFRLPFHSKCLGCVAKSMLNLFRHYVNGNTQPKDEVFCFLFSNTKNQPYPFSNTVWLLTSKLRYLNRKCRAKSRSNQSEWMAHARHYRFDSFKTHELNWFVVVVRCAQSTILLIYIFYSTTLSPYAQPFNQQQYALFSVVMTFFPFVVVVVAAATVALW